MGFLEILKRMHGSSSTLEFSQLIINQFLRLRLFRLKRILGDYFTPACVFGTYRKLDQTEIILPVDCKISFLTRKTISIFILPSNDFQTWKIEKREKEQEERVERVS